MLTFGARQVHAASDQSADVHCLELRTGDFVQFVPSSAPLDCEKVRPSQLPDAPLKPPPISIQLCTVLNLQHTRAVVGGTTTLAWEEAAGFETRFWKCLGQLSPLVVSSDLLGP